MKKILIVEDDPAIVRLLKVAMKINSYESIVATTGLEGISLFLSNNPDLVLLDLGLPDIEGAEVLSQIKAQSNTPVIIVSARGKEKEKVDALDAGATDYITKPFNVNELLARIRVAFRNNTNKEYKNNIFVYNDLVVDFDKHTVTNFNEQIHFTPIEFNILKLLIDNIGKVITHSFIQKKIWGYDSIDEYQSLRVYMAAIRRKLDNPALKVPYIVTEVGIGYRFAE